MSKSTRRLPERDMLAVMRHMCEVAALKQDPQAQRQLFIDGLNAMVGSNAAFFYVAQDWSVDRDPWFSHVTIARDPDPAFLEHVAAFGVKFPLDDDPYCYRTRRDRRTGQTWTIGDALADVRSRKRHAAFVELLERVNYSDGAVSLCRFGNDGHQVVGVAVHHLGKAARARGRKLRPRDLALIELAVREACHLAKAGHLTLPPIGPDNAPLPPRLRQVLDLLLAGHPPKACAKQLGLSIWTVREHIQRVYRHFNVAGREELMARFVRGS